MKADDLKNYGINMHDLSKTIPKKTWRLVQNTTLSTVRKELGLWTSLKLLFLIRKKTKEYSKGRYTRINLTIKSKGNIYQNIRSSLSYYW